MSTDRQKQFPSDGPDLGKLMISMRAAYLRGENVMQHARQLSNDFGNSLIATLIAYDLQAGSYIAEARANPEAMAVWCGQLAGLLNPYVTHQSSILEVGCGEATTLAGVLQRLTIAPRCALGFDISWSRCAHGLTWLAESAVSANLFVADLFEIPLEDDSIDLIYTSHSLEPNGGREEAAIKELMRVARKAVVMVEPLYELAGKEAQARMKKHGYVQGLREASENLGARVVEYRLLDYSGNPLNPSGLVLIEKRLQTSTQNVDIQWRCPLTLSPLIESEQGFYSRSTGMLYPVLAGIPMLRSSHSIVASSFELLVTHQNFA